jgi:hypothetical protein
MDMDRLFGDKLTKKKGNKQIVDTANIFINFESLYNVIRRPDIDKYVATATKKEIRGIYRNAMSAFINVAAHYREYFNRRHISTNIIYYYNEIDTDYIDYNNTALVPGYRDHFIDSLNSLDRLTINSLIVDSIPFMNIITDYIDGVYMVGSKRVEASLIPYIIMMENKFPANVNMFITKDPYDYLYTAKNCILITRFCAEPVILTKHNIMRFLRHKNKWFPDQNGEKVRELNPLLLPIFFAFLGERKRSLPKIKHVGFVRVYTALEKLYDVGYLFDEDPDTLNYTNIIKVLYDESKTLFNGPGIADDLLNSCMACDLDYQLNVVSKAQTDAIMDQLTNKPDMQALYDINEKYFSYYPLMLMELERYAPKTKLQRTLNFSEDDDNEYL